MKERREKSGISSEKPLGALTNSSHSAWSLETKAITMAEEECHYFMAIQDLCLIFNIMKMQLQRQCYISFIHLYRCHVASTHKTVLPLVKVLRTSRFCLRETRKKISVLRRKSRTCHLPIIHLEGLLWANRNCIFQQYSLFPQPSH